MIILKKAIKLRMCVGTRNNIISFDKVWGDGIIFKLTQKEYQDVY